MDFLPEGVGTDLRAAGLHEAAVAILTAAAQMERRTRGDQGDWAGPREPIDFPAWLSSVLATVADDLGGVGALVAGRPGSWEAEHVARLAEDGR